MTTRFLVALLAGCAKPVLPVASQEPPTEAACFGAGVWTPSGERGPLPDDCNQGRCEDGRWVSTTLLDCRIEILERVYFAPTSADIPRDSDPVITEVAAAVLDNPALVPVLQVQGHTAADEDASLGQLRARAVADALMRNGVASERLVVRGFGNEAPLSDDPAENRRVDFFVPPRP